MPHAEELAPAEAAVGMVASNAMLPKGFDMPGKSIFSSLFCR